MNEHIATLRRILDEGVEIICGCIRGDTGVEGGQLRPLMRRLHKKLNDLLDTDCAHLIPDESQQWPFAYAVREMSLEDIGTSDPPLRIGPSVLNNTSACLLTEVLGDFVSWSAREKEVAISVVEDFSHEWATKRLDPIEKSFVENMVHQ